MYKFSALWYSYLTLGKTRPEQNFNLVMLIGKEIRVADLGQERHGVQERESLRYNVCIIFLILLSCQKITVQKIYKKSNKHHKNIQRYSRGGRGIRNNVSQLLRAQSTNMWKYIVKVQYLRTTRNRGKEATRNVTFLDKLISMSGSHQDHNLIKQYYSIPIN